MSRCTKLGDWRAFALRGSFTYKLLARYRRRPQTSSLLFAKRGQPDDTHSLDQERAQLIQTAIREFYVRRECPRAYEVRKNTSDAVLGQKEIEG
jgi:hypothetical protein